jgi:Fe-S cluster biogenesis protein NfuA
MADQLDPAHVAERIEEVLESLDPAARPAGEELVRLLMRFYGAGLEQIVTISRAGTGDGAVHRLAADPLVGGLLALHDLHPVDVRTRVEHAISAAKRKLGSHGGDVALIGIDVDGTVRIALGASGCGGATVKEVVSDEVTAAAPDATGVAFVEADNGAGGLPLLQIGMRATS